MSFLFGRFGKNKGRGIPRDATFRITQEGRNKLQEFSGDPKSKILMAMEVRGVSLDADEIAESSGIGRGQVERLMPQLLRGGYIQYVSANMGAEVE